ncbi:hypothetical protein P8452_31083 [Trifolium repens]|nr:hypothetical protein P8452_31083 [Trifolium repens]
MSLRAAIEIAFSRKIDSIDDTISSESVDSTALEPHVMTVNPGEDVVAKIHAFLENDPLAAVYILCAVGSVSSVVLQQPGIFCGLLKFEGLFEILSLRPWNFTSGGAGARSQMCKLSVSLARPDFSVFGAPIVNSMIAATPILLGLAIYKQNTSNQTMGNSSFSTAQNKLN